MKNFLRLALLCCLIFSTVLSVISCTETPDNSGDSTTLGKTTDAETEEKDPFQELPSKNYDGYEFTIMVRDDDANESDMFQEDSEKNDNVQSALYLRNLTVEEKYSITLVPFRHNADKSSLNSMFADEDAFDLILPHARYSSVYAGYGLLADWNDLPYVNTEAEWWDQNCIQELSIKDHLYFATGGISIQSYGATDLLIFNKELFEDLQLEEPYQTVKDGSWTVEAFQQLVRKGSKDLNADDQFDIDNDQFGYMTAQFLGDVQCYHATGNRVITKDTSDTPEITFFTDRANAVWDWYSEFINDSSVYFDLNTAYWFSDSTVAFRSGRVLFTDIMTSNINVMRQMDDDFGIIPWPVFREGDKYLSNVDAGLHLFCIPITASDLERTSLILEALCIYGYQKVIPEFYEVTVRTKGHRDEESLEMLDIIFDGRVYDLGYYNVELTGSVAENEAIANNFRTVKATAEATLATIWAQYSGSAQTCLTTYLENLAKNNNW